MGHSIYIYFFVYISYMYLYETWRTRVVSHTRTRHESWVTWMRHVEWIAYGTDGLFWFWLTMNNLRPKIQGLESCLMHELVMSHVWMSQVICMDGSKRAAHYWQKSHYLLGSFAENDFQDKGDESHVWVEFSRVWLRLKVAHACHTHESFVA